MDFDWSSAEEEEFDWDSASEGDEEQAAPSWRDDIMSELDDDPETRMLAMQMLDTEGGGVATLEALVNRTGMIRQRIPDWTIGKELNSGFYGPINRGYAQTRRLHPGSVDVYQKYIDEVRAGSNVIQGRTDQGSKNDPNVHGPGRVFLKDNPGEVYNYWTGRRGGIEFSHADSAKFAEEVLSGGPKFADTGSDSAKQAVTEARQPSFDWTSAKEEEFDWSSAADDKSHGAEVPPAGPQPVSYLPDDQIKGKMVKMNTTDPETGEQTEQEMDAAEAQGLVKNNINAYTALMECLSK